MLALNLNKNFKKLVGFPQSRTIKKSKYEPKLSLGAPSIVVSLLQQYDQNWRLVAYILWLLANYELVFQPEKSGFCFTQ